ncbi:MAG: SDR family NAD(P)-dependent oxidoreductase [Actinobacteria bacterium]|nr:SDR family NAD(P)-dependent oxidoreductase [Actinomycetota bacterium]MBU1943245.1 SDR family NAD(P)-dependent oxidoreductase [Actinomycetota bacterium]MBU2685967.1 SDR family NAD(P)-dependent oxidoreductase [Actinomycetota bacterium]
MKQIRGMLALVTGAASGIGRATALELAREGCRLALVDVNADRLGEVRREVESLGAECSTHVVDVSCRDSIASLGSELEISGGVDILANVAGVAVGGTVVDTTLDDWDWIIGINLMGPINTIGTFLPGMVLRGRGHVVNVSSLGGLCAVPGLGAYSTTKFGLAGLSETMHIELKGTGVGVTLVCPGLTNTRLHEQFRLRGIPREMVDWAVEHFMPRMFSAEKTGYLIVRAIKRNRFIVMTTLFAKFNYFLKRLSPILYRGMWRAIYRVTDALKNRRY